MMQLRLLYLSGAILLSLILWSRELILIYIALALLALICVAFLVRACLIARGQRRLQRFAAFQDELPFYDPL
jgi:hypothetical protein